MASVLKVDTIKSLAGNEAITISEGGVPQLKVPIFRVYRTTNQTLTSNTTAVVQWNSVSLDPNGWWDAVNYRWQPQIAGYYWLSTILHLSGSAAPTRRIITIIPTGDDEIRAFDDNISASINIRTGGGIAYFNGTTDYVSVSVTVTATSPIVTGVAGGSYARFEGFLVRAA